MKLRLFRKQKSAVSSKQSSSTRSSTQKSLPPTSRETPESPRAKHSSSASAAVSALSSLPPYDESGKKSSMILNPRTGGYEAPSQVASYEDKQLDDDDTLLDASIYTDGYTIEAPSSQKKSKSALTPRQRLEAYHETSNVASWDRASTATPTFAPSTLQRKSPTSPYSPRTRTSTASTSPSGSSVATSPITAEGNQPRWRTMTNHRGEQSSLTQKDIRRLNVTGLAASTFESISTNGSFDTATTSPQRNVSPDNSSILTPLVGLDCLMTTCSEMDDENSILTLENRQCLYPSCPSFPHESTLAGDSPPQRQHQTYSLDRQKGSESGIVDPVADGTDDSIYTLEHNGVYQRGTDQNTIKPRVKRKDKVSPKRPSAARSSSIQNDAVKTTPREKKKGRCRTLPVEIAGMEDDNEDEGTCTILFVPTTEDTGSDQVDPLFSSHGEQLCSISLQPTEERDSSLRGPVDFDRVSKATVVDTNLRKPNKSVKMRLTREDLQRHERKSLKQALAQKKNAGIEDTPMEDDFVLWKREEQIKKLYQQKQGDRNMLLKDRKSLTSSPNAKENGSKKRRKDRRKDGILSRVFTASRKEPDLGDFSLAPMTAMEHLKLHETVDQAPPTRGFFLFRRRSSGNVSTTAQALLEKERLAAKELHRKKLNRKQQDNHNASKTHRNIVHEQKVKALALSPAAPRVNEETPKRSGRSHTDARKSSVASRSLPRNR
jgi:hypothetical protein